VYLKILKEIKEKKNKYVFEKLYLIDKQAEWNDFFLKKAYGRLMFKDEYYYLNSYYYRDDSNKPSMLKYYLKNYIDYKKRTIIKKR